MYVLKRRKDGRYIVLGGDRATTDKLQNATWFRRLESAQCERCEGESVVMVQREVKGAIL